MMRLHFIRLIQFRLLQLIYIASLLIFIIKATFLLAWLNDNIDIAISILVSIFLFS